MAAVVSASLAELSQSRRLAILLSVGLVTAIEISNRISINVLLPDMQGNVAASTDEISWVIILYNLGFPCSLALSSWITSCLVPDDTGCTAYCSTRSEAWAAR
jgi:MFS transporter, DHA2 family, multidrug resistance protein